MPKTAAAKTSTRASRARVEQPVAVPRSAGSVAFVGTGPGDPGLLTVRATELIAAADVVITEAPEHESLAAVAPRRALRRGHRRRRWLRRGRPAADPRVARQARRQARQGRRQRRPADLRRPVDVRHRRRGGRRLRQGVDRLRDRARRQLGDRGPGVRRRAADDPHLARGHRAQRRRDQDRLVAATSTCRRWCCSAAPAGSATSPRR